MATADITPHHSRANQAPRYNVRRAAAIGGSILALMGLYAAGKAGYEVSGLGGPHYTQEELGDLKKEQVVVEPGQGADAAIAAVEVEALEDAGIRYELGNYIQDQGQGGILQAGQSVEVPIIPGMENEEKSPSQPK